MREKLAEIDDMDERMTNVMVLIDGMVEGAKGIARARQLSKELIVFMKEARDSTEGRPAQKITVNGPAIADPVGVLKQLVSDCLGRVPGILDD